MASIFISYSRKDNDIVKQFAADLEAIGIDVWLDADDLTPGTLNWEQAIRDALGEAIAVVLMASPDSRKSVYVQGELSLAQIHQCPVYPLWIAGEQWIDSIPLGMVNYQYIDCRAESYQAGFKTIVQTIQEISDKSKGSITLSLPSHERIEINLAQFDNAQSFLNHLYVKYMNDWYDEWTYGTEWVLANIETKQLAVPWEWLSIDRKSKSTPVHRLISNWRTLMQNATLSDFGIINGSSWAVWEAKRIRIGGVAVNDNALKNKILSAYGQLDIWNLEHKKCLAIHLSDEIDVSQFEHQFVIALLRTSKDRIVFSQTDNPCEDI